MVSCKNKRRCTDVMKLMTEFKVELIDKVEFTRFNVEFHGPKDSPYEGGVWVINVQMSYEYPFRPPSIMFGSRIYHPNIDEPSGIICLDVLYKKWNSAFDLVIVFEMFLPQLLLHPNPEDPVNSLAAELLISNKPAFDQTVRDHVKRYATPGVEKSGEEKTKHRTTDDDEDENSLKKSVDPMVEQSDDEDENYLDKSVDSMVEQSDDEDGNSLDKSVDPKVEQCDDEDGNSLDKSVDEDGNSLEKSVDLMVEQSDDLPPVGKSDDEDENSLDKSVDPIVEQYDDVPPVGKSDDEDGNSLDKCVDPMVEQFEDLPPVGKFEDLPPPVQFEDFPPVRKRDEPCSSSKPT